jgi:hypothetical protein
MNTLANLCGALFLAAILAAGFLQALDPVSAPVLGALVADQRLAAAHEHSR